MSKLKAKLIIASSGYSKMPTYNELKKLVESMKANGTVAEADIRSLYSMGAINQSQLEDLITIVNAVPAKNFRNTNQTQENRPGALYSQSSKIASNHRNVISKSLKKIAVEFLQMQNCDQKTIQLLDDAIEHQTKVQIQYGDGDSYFTIDPFAWHSSKEGNPTVKAYNANGEVRSYTVSKIKNIKALANDSSEDRKYNEEINRADEYTDLQNKYDKDYAKDFKKPYQNYNN